MLAYDNLDESLINFLSHNDTFTKQNTAAVIDTIESRLKTRLKARELELFDAPAQDMDIFISYSRSDSAIAEAMYNAFTSLGIRVWYDKKNLTDGGYFMDEIYRAIRTARYFVPIFTTNITKEKADSHVYRNEWEEAVRVATSMGRTYIIPVAEKGFDFYKAIIPEKIQKHNAVLFDSTDNIENVVQRIIHKMNQQ